MLSGYSFRPRAWAFAAAAAACAAGIALGNWQARRADEKRAAAEQVQRIVVLGEFLPERTVLLDNKVHAHRAGYEVVTPLRLDGIHVLVNRGWLQAGKSRDALPAAFTPREEVRVEGLALARLPRVLEPGPIAPGKVRLNIDVAAFEKETGLGLHPIVIEQHSALPDGLLREWPRPDAGVEKHRGYALQWYSLAGLAVVLFVVLSFRRVAAP